MRESEVMQRICEELKRVLKMEFKHELDAIKPRLTADEKDQLYRNRVADILRSEENPFSKLRETWREYDFSRFIRTIIFNMDIREDGKVGTIYVESDWILYERHRGISHMLWEKRDEAYGCRPFPSTIPPFRLWMEKLEKQGEPSIRFIKAAAELAEKISGETGVDLVLAKDIWGIDDTVLPMFFLASCDLPPSAEETFNEVMKMVEAVKQAWTEWLEIRDQLCEELGMSEEVFAVRDAVENAFNLPPWVASVRPGRRGGEVFIDPGRLEACFEKKPYESSLWAPQDFPVPWFQLEFDKTHPEKPVYVYSPPVDLGHLVGKIIIEEKGGKRFHSLRDVPGASEVVETLLKRMKELDVNPLEYLTGRRRLEEINVISPLLARKMGELARFLERSRESLGEITLYPVNYADSPLTLWTIDPEEYKYDRYIYLDVISFSLRLKLYTPTDYRVVKECTQWILQCLKAYSQVKELFQEFW